MANAMHKVAKIIATCIGENTLLVMTHKGLTPWLTGAGARSAEGTNIGHENAEGMAYVGVRVEPAVRLGREEEGLEGRHALKA